MKKLLFRFGTFGVSIAAIATITSCGSNTAAHDYKKNATNIFKAFNGTIAVNVSTDFDDIQKKLTRIESMADKTSAMKKFQGKLLLGLGKTKMTTINKFTSAVKQSAVDAFQSLFLDLSNITFTDANVSEYGISKKADAEAYQEVSKQLSTIEKGISSDDSTQISIGANIEIVTNDLKALSAILSEKSDSEFSTIFIQEMTATNSHFLSLGLPFVVPITPDGINIKIEKDFGKMIHFKVTSTADSKGEEFDVTFDKFTDIRNVVIALNQVKSTTVSESAFIGMEVTWTSSSDFAQVLTSLGIDYAMPSEPDGITIEVSKSNGKEIIYWIYSDLDTKGQRIVVTFNSFG